VKPSYFTVLAIGATTVVLFAFQNCAGPLQLNTKDVGSAQSSSTNPGGTNATPTNPQTQVPTQQCMFILTSGSVWTVPGDWNSSDNSIEAVGNGYDAGGNVRGGGGGGAYSKSVNVMLSPHTQASYNVAHVTVSLGAGNSAGDVYFCRSTSGCASLTDSSVVVSAQGGHGSTNGANLDSVGGIGGQASAGIATGPGAIKYSGGNGGNCSDGACGNFASPGGGGGAAGPHGNGVTSPGTAGGTGDNGSGGGGGAAGSQFGDSNGPGAGSPGNPGGNGSEYDSAHGIGGGGGAGGYGEPGGNGGTFGGGAAGSGTSYYQNTTGGAGMIVIKYLGTSCN